MPVVKIPRRKSGAGAYVGRNVRVTVGAFDLSGAEPTVELLIEAPAPVAVSRDDEGIERHVRRQHKLDVKHTEPEADVQNQR